MPSKVFGQKISDRFRGLLPIVVDVETSGLNSETDALLELAAISLTLDETGKLSPSQTFSYQIEAFKGARMDPESLEITGIDPDYPLRYAIPEQQALYHFFTELKELLEKNNCHRAVLVGHNAWFDLAFIQSAAKRAHLPYNPFHSFTSFDTATLSAIYFGETVLARAARAARIRFDINQAHSAIYDVTQTANLFCYIVNRMNYQPSFRPRERG